MATILHPKIYNVDRYQISTVIHQPEGKGPYPAVIILPGFTDGKDEPHIIAIAEFLAARGYLTLRFDPTGIGESEGTKEEDYRISTYLNDVDTVITYLKHQGNIDEKRIGLWGTSLGGMLSIIFAAEYTYVKAVVAVSPPPTFEMPEGYAREAHKYSALAVAASLKQPILTVIGAADTVVAPADTLQIYEAITGQKKLIDIPKMTHEYSDVPEFVEKINEESGMFFDEFLK